MGEQGKNGRQNDSDPGDYPRQVIGAGGNNEQHQNQR
jgi:hypothetical protein